MAAENYSENYYKKPANKAVWAGRAPIREESIVENATNMYPGRLVKYGTTVAEIVVNDGVSPVAGWLGYDNTSSEYKKDSVDEIYDQYAHVEVLSGGGFGIVAALAAGFKVEKGDLLIPWSNGTVAPAIRLPTGLAVKIPFAKSTTEYDTMIDLVANMLVGIPAVKVDTAASSATIDAGILSSESGGDADGFIDGLSCANTGLFTPSNLVDATEGNITLGALLSEHIKSADSTALYAALPVTYRCDGTAVSISYTTSNHTIAGSILLPICSMGTMPVGVAAQSLSASAGIQDLLAKSLI